MANKQADLAGPGIGSYEEVERVLPANYTSLLSPRETQQLKRQLELTGQLDFLDFPYHKAILNDEIPLSVGGGIGQARTYMLLLKKAHIGEVSVTVWPPALQEMCAEKRIHVLESRAHHSIKPIADENFPGYFPGHSRATAGSMPLLP